MAVSTPNPFLDKVVKQFRSAIEELGPSCAKRKDLHSYHEVCTLVSLVEHIKSLGYLEDFLDGNQDPLQSIIAAFVPQPIEPLDQRPIIQSVSTATVHDPSLITPSKSGSGTILLSAGYSSSTIASGKSRLPVDHSQASTPVHSPSRSPSPEEERQVVFERIQTRKQAREQAEKAAEQKVDSTVEASAPEPSAKDAESVAQSFIDELFETDTDRKEGKPGRHINRAITRGQYNIFSTYWTDGSIDKNVLPNINESYDDEFMRFFPGQNANALDQLGWPRYMGIGLMPNGEVPPRCSRKGQELMVMNRYFAMHIEHEKEQRDISPEERAFLMESTMRRIGKATDEIEDRFAKMACVPCATSTTDTDAPTIKSTRMSFKGKAQSELKSHQSIIARSFWKAYETYLTPTQKQFIRQQKDQHDFFFHYSQLVHRAINKISGDLDIISMYVTKGFMIPVGDDITFHFQYLELLCTLYYLASGSERYMSDQTMVQALNHSLRCDDRFDDITKDMQKLIEARKPLEYNYYTFRQRCYERSEFDKLEKQKAEHLKSSSHASSRDTKQTDSRSGRRDRGRDNKSISRTASPGRFLPYEQARSPA